MKANTPERTAQNIIKKYSLQDLYNLLNMFKSGASCTIIAQSYKVSRQRVFQWKKCLGNELVSYDINPEVEKLILNSNFSRTTV